MELNAETLQAALEKGDVQACLALFAGKSEKERQAVANLAAIWLKRQAKEMFLDTGPGTLSRNTKLDAAEVAALASCSFSELKKFGWRGVPLEENAYEVMLDRRPPWVEQWATMVLEINPRHFSLVRRLVREGLCPR